MDFIAAVSVLDELATAIKRNPSTVHSQAVVVRSGVLDDSLDALLWALDEIQELRVDLEMLNRENADLRDELDGAYAELDALLPSDNDLLHEQTLAYHAGLGV